jgi:hypothetical protein
MISEEYNRTIKADEVNRNIKQKLSTEIELHTEEFLFYIPINFVCLYCSVVFF